MHTIGSLTEEEVRHCAMLGEGQGCIETWARVRCDIL